MPKGIKDYIREATEFQTRHRDELILDSKYYEAAHVASSLGSAMPPQMQKLSASVGWSRLYLDSLVERIAVEGFRYSGQNEADDRLYKWWEFNDMDEDASIAHLETFIHGRCYISVAAPSTEDLAMGHPSDTPVIRVESPRYMWADIDERTKRVNYAVRFFKEPNNQFADKDQYYTLYLPNETIVLTESRNGNLRVIDRVTHNLGIVPIVPALNRERVGDRLGRSEIIPELRNMQDIATRVVMNMQAASELMAVPQRLLFGVGKEDIADDPNDPYAKYKAFMANILTFKNSDARADQFTPAELSNYTTVLQELSKQVASYTGLPPQYLSFSQNNPASAEAIRSSEARLVKTCELKSDIFANVWERVMRLGMLIIDGSVPEDAMRMEAVMADPSTPTFAAKSDAVRKLVGKNGQIIPVEQARVELGYSPAEREQINEMAEKEREEALAQIMEASTTRNDLPTAQDLQTDNPEADTAP